MAIIQFINPPSYMINQMMDKWYLPINLIWLATYLEGLGNDVEIIDGQHCEIEDILNNLNGDIVGVYYNIASAAYIDVIVRKAKLMGMTTVIGGQGVRYIVECLLNNQNIDYVVYGDGEKALEKLALYMEGKIKEINNVPGIAYKCNNQIYYNHQEVIDINVLQIPNRMIKGIDINKYIDYFTITNTTKGISGKRITNAHTKRGCPYKCSFCARSNTVYMDRNPQLVVNEYEELIKKFGIDYIFDHSDTWIMNKEWMKEYSYLINKSTAINVPLGVFGDIRKIDSEMVSIIERTNIRTIYIGMETGCENVYYKNKHSMLNIKKVNGILQELGYIGVNIELSYVLGLVNDNEYTIMETIEQSIKLAGNNSKINVYYNILLPLPGTEIWTRFTANNRMRKKYENKYIYNIPELRRDYFDSVGELGEDGYERICAIVNEANMSVMNQCCEYVR